VTVGWSDCYSLYLVLGNSGFLSASVVSSLPRPGKNRVGTADVQTYISLLSGGCGLCARRTYNKEADMSSTTNVPNGKFLTYPRIYIIF
jgi:hypothetical protein